jgi:hypothetical protein
MNAEIRVDADQVSIEGRVVDLPKRSADLTVRPHP